MSALWEALKPAIGEAAGFFIVCAVIGLLACRHFIADCIRELLYRAIELRPRTNVRRMLNEIERRDRVAK